MKTGNILQNDELAFAAGARGHTQGDVLLTQVSQFQPTARARRPEPWIPRVVFRFLKPTRLARLRKAHGRTKRNKLAGMMGTLRRQTLAAAFAVAIRRPLQKANVVLNPEPARSRRSSRPLQPDAKLFLKLLLCLSKQNLLPRSSFHCDD